jgi:hypothetical protein
MKQNKEKVYCNYCIYHSAISFYSPDCCTVPALTSERDTPIDVILKYPECGNINKNNDCPYFNNGKYSARDTIIAVCIVVVVLSLIAAKVISLIK